MSGLFQIIRNEGDNKALIWKSPIVDFNTGSQLIVHEYEEAIFFMNGQALDLFGAGRHTLETQNIPLLKQAFSLPTSRQTPFHCEVYFINKTEQMLKWGTNNQVEYLDPQYKFPLAIGASGEMALRVEDSRRLLLKIVGVESKFDGEDLKQFFRGLLLARIKPLLAQAMSSGRFGIFEVEAHMDDLSTLLYQLIAPDFKAYGIETERFVVTNIAKPIDDPNYIKFKNLHCKTKLDVEYAKRDQEIKIINAQTDAKIGIIRSAGVTKEREQEGYTYQQEKAYEVAKGVVENEGNGNIFNTGIDLGMMVGVAGGIGAAAAGIALNALNPIIPRCESTQSGFTDAATESNPAPSIIDLKNEGKPENNASPMGDRAADKVAAFEDRLKMLEIVVKAGLLTDEQIEEKKNEIRNSI